MGKYKYGETRVKPSGVFRNAVKDFGRNFAQGVKMVYNLVINHPTEAFLAGWLAASPILASQNEADATGSFRQIGVPMVFVSVAGVENTALTLIGAHPIEKANGSVYGLYVHKENFELTEICIATKDEEGRTNMGFIVGASSDDGQMSLYAKTGVDVKITSNLAAGLVWDLETIKGVTASLRATLLGGNVTLYGKTSTSEWDPMVGAQFNLWDKATLQGASNLSDELTVKASKRFATKIGGVAPEASIVLSKDSPMGYKASICIDM